LLSSVFDLMGRCIRVYLRVYLRVYPVLHTMSAGLGEMFGRPGTLSRVCTHMHCRGNLSPPIVLCACIDFEPGSSDMPLDFLSLTSCQAHSFECTVFTLCILRTPATLHTHTHTHTHTHIATCQFSRLYQALVQFAQPFPFCILRAMLCNSGEWAGQAQNGNRGLGSTSSAARYTQSLPQWQSSPLQSRTPSSNSNFTESINSEEEGGGGLQAWPMGHPGEFDYTVRHAPETLSGAGKSMRVAVSFAKRRLKENVCVWIGPLRKRDATVQKTVRLY